MNTSVWIRALALTALLASACGTSPGPATGSAASPSAAGASRSPTASAPSPSPLPSDRLLALVTLRGSSSVVVRDLTDISHPKTVGNFGSAYSPVFVSATEVSYAADSSLYRAPLAGSPKALVTSKGGSGIWSPDGSAVLFTTSVSPETITLHQLRAGRDQVLGTVPGGGAGGCESIESCQIPNFLDFRLLYSPDGTLISLVRTSFSGSSFRLWSSNGKLLKSSDARGPSMSTWSGHALYFRDAQGVEVWRDGVVSVFLPGVSWNRPRGSPTGSQIVYAVPDSTGWNHVYVVDTTTKKARDLKKGRVDPVYLTSRFLWYQGERACVADDRCGAHPPFHPLSGKTYIYDLQTGTETESIITGVYDAWPHAA